MLGRAVWHGACPIHITCCWRFVPSRKTMIKLSIQIIIYLHCPLFYLLCKYGPFRGHLMSHRCPTQLCPSFQPRPSPMVTQKPWREGGYIIPNQVQERVLVKSQAARAVRPGFETQVWHPLDTAVWTNASANKRLCLLVKGEWIRDLTVPSLDKRLPSNHREQQMIG